MSSRSAKTAAVKIESPPTATPSSAIGALFLIAQQFASRALTFVVNQVLLRYLSPSLLGISTQLELYSITVLFFARESLRVAIQRQADPSDPATFAAGNVISTPDGHVDARSAAGRSQAIVNLSYVSIAIGGLLAVVLAWLYLYGVSPEILATPYFRQSLVIYAIAAFWELLSEPCFVVVQQKSRFGIRASAETLATVLRCLMTCGSAVSASRLGKDIGVLPFALGQGVYALTLSVAYHIGVWSIATDGGFSLMLKSVYSTDPRAYLWSYFSYPLLRLTTSFFSQSILKHVLTQGDTFIISIFTTPDAQGVYAVAQNYGSLVARLLLQPLEEISRNNFGKMLSTIDGPPSPSKVAQAKKTLSMLLRTYALVSVFVVTAGPTLAPLLLKIVAGSRWTDAGAVLSTYCYYIPLLAMNGLTEAFVSSTATEAQLASQTGFMLIFSIGFAVASVVFLRVLELGAQGLVWANCFNMLMRIGWSQRFVRTYFKHFGSDFNVKALLPKPMTIAAGIGTKAVLAQMEIGFTGGITDVMKCGVVAGVFSVVLTVFEQAHFLECYRIFKG